MQDINFRIFEKFGADPLYDAEYGMILTHLACAEEEKRMLILWEEDQKNNLLVYRFRNESLTYIIPKEVFYATEHMYKRSSVSVRQSVPNFYEENCDSRGKKVF